MPGAYTRDKDAVSSCSLMAEIAAWAKDQGRSLFELLLDIYKEYGFSQEKMIYIVRKGLSGAEEIKAMMEQLRNQTPTNINGQKIIIKKDYSILQETNLLTGENRTLTFLTTSNVLQFFLEDGCKISIRPSGTEPKIKFYFEARAHLAHYSDFQQVQKEAMEKIDAIISDLNLN